MPSIQPEQLAGVGAGAEAPPPDAGDAVQIMLHVANNPNTAMVLSFLTMFR